MSDEVVFDEATSKAIMEREERMKNDFLAAMDAMLAKPSLSSSLLESPKAENLEPSHRSLSPEPNNDADESDVGKGEEEREILPMHRTLSTASSETLVPRPRSPTYARSNPIALRRIIANQLAQERIKQQKQALVGSAASDENGYGQAQQSLLDAINDRSKCVPAGLRFLVQATPHGKNPVDYGLPQLENMVHFELKFMRANWNLDAALPMIARSNESALPEIVVMASASETELWAPPFPQVHGALLHVCVRTITWPVMDDMHVFIRNLGLSEFTYAGKYGTPRDKGWDNKPFLPDVLGREDIAKLPKSVTNSIVSGIWTKCAGHVLASADEIKTLAAHFFPEIYWREGPATELRQKKKELTTKLMELRFEEVRAAFEEVSEGMRV
ncbi:MAG: hypothetical protein Q9165_006843 [Trypethelium subeluteriae]